jgi:hypothetical protein
MTYTPRRTAEFEYVWELISHIEHNQCFDCAFSKPVVDPDSEPHSSEYPMCYEIEAAIIAEEPLEALDEAPDGVVVCSLYKNKVLAEQEHPDQGRLYD